MTIHLWQAVFYSFCLVSLIQILYYLYFFLRIAIYKAKPVNSSQIHPVSLIICARDEAANLVQNLPKVLNQKFRATHEVIVVEDNSFDESKYILEEYQKNFKHLRVVKLKQEAKLIPGKKFPLSVGIKSAKHDIVLLTDADCAPATDAWIEKMQEAYTGNIEIVLGYGAYRKTKSLLNKLIRWETFHTALQYLSYARAGFAYMGVGRNLSYKKSVFFRQKGFSSHINIASGDDDLFINSAATGINTAIVIDKDAFTVSEPAKHWKEWIHQKTRHFSTGKYYRSEIKFLLGLYSLSHFLFYPLFFAALFLYNSKIVLVIFAARFILQAYIFYRSMKKLNEQDLFPWFTVLDAWMFFYYLLFSRSIFNKPSRKWK